MLAGTLKGRCRSFFAFEQGKAGQELMAQQQITDICEGRDQTIAMWLDPYDHCHATCAASRTSCRAGCANLPLGLQRQVV